MRFYNKNLMFNYSCLTKGTPMKITGKKLLLAGALFLTILAPANSACGWFSRIPGTCSTRFINSTCKRCIKLITPFIAGYTQLKNLDDCINTVYVKKDPRRDAIASTFLLLDNKKQLETLASQRGNIFNFMKKKGCDRCSNSACPVKNVYLDLKNSDIDTVAEKIKNGTYKKPVLKDTVKKE